MPEDVPLRAYIDTRFADHTAAASIVYMGLQTEMDRRFLAQEKAMLAALEAAKEALAAALAASEKAATLADQQTRDWQKHSNEWRGAMNDRERTFLTRREFYTIAGTLISAAGVATAVLIAVLNHV